MLKKIMLLISCFCILILVACGYAGDISPQATAEFEDAYMEIMTFSSAIPVGTEHVTIEIVTEEMLVEIRESFDNEISRWHEVDFAHETGGFITEGVTLLFTVNETIINPLIPDTIINCCPGDFPHGSRLVVTNFPIGQATFINYSNFYEVFTYHFAVNANGELISEQWSLMNYEHYDEDIEIDLDNAFSIPMLDPIDQLSILPIELILAEDNEVDWQATIRNIIDQNQANHITNFDYDEVFFSRPMVDLNRMILPPGDYLLISSAMTIHDVEIISLEAIDGDFQTNFRIVDHFGVSDEISPGAGILIHNYLSVGHFPLSGITFTNESGLRMYYLIFQDHSDEFPPYRLIPFSPI